MRTKQLSCRRQWQPGEKLLERFAAAGYTVLAPVVERAWQQGFAAASTGHR